MAQHVVRSGGRALLAIVASSLLLKLVLLVPAHHSYPGWDARDYFTLAHQLHASGEYGGRRPPLYPAVLAASIQVASWLGDDSLTKRPRLHPVDPVSDLDLIRFAQVLLSTATVLLVYLLGLELFDRRAALFAAAIFAFLPDMVAFSHLLWSETLFFFLNAAWVLLLVRGARADRIGMLLAAGAVLALAALTRQVVASFLIAIVAWLFLVQPRPWRRTATWAAAVALGFAIMIAPWTVRNALEHGVVAPVAGRTGLAFLYGAVADVPRELARIGATPDKPHAEIDRLAGERARQIIRDDPVAYLDRALTVNLPGLWSLDSTALRLLPGSMLKSPGAVGYPEVPGWLGRSIVALFVASFVGVLACAVAGAGLAPRWRETCLFIGLVLHACALHALLGANERHRLYLMAFATLYAGFLLSRSKGEIRSGWTPLRVATTLVALFSFGLAIAAARSLRLTTQWQALGG